MANFTHINNCRLCESTNFLSILPLARTPVGDLYLPILEQAKKLQSFPLNVFQCGDCGHVQLRAIVDPDYLYTEYIYTTASSLGLADHFRNYAVTVCKKLALLPGSFIVEIGSNDGTLLTAFKELGMNVLGVDPAREISERATESGVPTLNAFFSPELARFIRSQYGCASLFIANNVLANVPEPAEIVQGIKELLQEDGVFIFETGYLRYLAEDYAFDNIYHEHIDYYSIKPLVTFFERLGMDLFDVEASTSKGSSIRCYVQFTSGVRTVSPEVNRFISREIQVGYAQPHPYHQLSQKLSDIKDDLHKLLSSLKDGGKKIAGYGASVGVTTVLYHLELGKFLEKLIDDNPVRHGLFSPGLAIPVVGSSYLESEDAPDVLLILAWRYAEPIIEKNLEYRKRGGKFIRFLPEIEII